MRSVKAAIITVLLVCTLGCGFAPDVTSRYAVPLEEDLQVFVIRECEARQIDPAIVFAMMDAESDFDIYAIGDNGKAFGLLQVQPRFHYERMRKLNCTDLLDPKQNVTVAVDYLAELIGKYDNVEKALTAYNSGEYGAQQDYFKHGVTASHYAREVLSTFQIITEGAYTDVYS